MGEKTANAIYDILVEYGGANPEHRDHFVDSHSRYGPTNQFRFQGHFGFGGKLYTDGSEFTAWRVSYHPGDVLDNPELYESLCKAINVMLRQLWEEKNDGERIRDDGERERG